MPFYISHSLLYIYKHTHTHTFSDQFIYKMSSESMAELEIPDVMLKMIRFLSSLLQRVAESNDEFRCLDAEKTSIFDGLSRPAISIECYMERIFKYANCSPSCIVVAYIYLDRFAQKQPMLPLNSFNVHRLLIASVLLSAKFMDDIFYNNAYYAKVGGISTSEMNLLEVDFLFGLGFQLNVSTSTYHHYCSYLQKEMLLHCPPLTVTPNLLRSRNIHLYVDE
ncbi:cyclin-U4-1-like [Salvia miltiorrhiza]|uniref:cyclin-U4-1-like n=1 Tax=Salvia miltiorrhiza TaxID=226208 RepID=UPI0025AC0C18|nr:cyclin-U4-1-like [Salvia miltiorrhiza]